MEPSFLIQTLLVGVAVGLISNGLGLGGGILMVPAFLTIVPVMDLNTAKGSSLLIIVFVAAINAWRLGRCLPHRPWKLAGTIAAASVVGGYTAGWATSRMPETPVALIFIVLLVLLALRTFLLRPHVVREDEVRERNVMAGTIGLVTGIFSGATGTGGGAVLIPLALMTDIVSNEHVVALSNHVMVATCAAGTLAHLLAPRTTNLPWTFGHVNLAMAPLVLLGSMAVGPWGRQINRHLTLERRRLVMGVLLAAIAVKFLCRIVG